METLTLTQTGVIVGCEYQIRGALVTFNLGRIEVCFTVKGSEWSRITKMRENTLLPLTAMWGYLNLFGTAFGYTEGSIHNGGDNSVPKQKWCNSFSSCTVFQQMHQRNLAIDTSSCCPEMLHFNSLLCKVCCFIALLIQEVPHTSAKKAVSKLWPCLPTGWVWNIFMYQTLWMFSVGIRFCMHLGSGVMVFSMHKRNSEEVVCPRHSARNAQRWGPLFPIITYVR